GQTSAGRKGTSWSEVLRVIEPLDADWRQKRIVSGMSTGEGIIFHVRDALEGKEAVKDKGKIVSYQDVIIDHGVADKRLMVLETEFGRPLQAMRREASTLSAVIRQGWDGDHLRTLTKSFPHQATGAHLSIIGHVTSEELVR